MAVLANSNPAQSIRAAEGENPSQPILWEKKKLAVSFSNVTVAFYKAIVNRKAK
jgi:hypothetical protein